MSTNENSVLNQIIASHKLEELSGLNVIEIINYLLTHLNERERDVISRRYGLKDGNKEILESIGKAHGLTRERIRQIETSSLDKLRKARDLDKIKRLKKIIIQIIEEHGGLIEMDYLFDVLVHFSVRGEGRREREKTHQNSFDFLLAKILNDDFDVITNSSYFKPSYKLSYFNIDHYEELAEALEKIIAERSEVLPTEDVILLIQELDAYGQHKEKLDTGANIDLSGVLKYDWFKENYDLVNKHKPLYTLLRSSKNIEQNVFGHWGLAHWPEIKPKNINDKIYLVLKNFGKHLHFTEITNKINDIKFDKKRANVASTHNELILDPKYILIGRGMYGLKEWGYSKGTVNDVIAEILRENGPLTKEEIINKVMEKRVVKKTTVILALANKNHFKRVNGKYEINENAAAETVDTAEEQVLQEAGEAQE